MSDRLWGACGGTQKIARWMAAAPALLAAALILAACESSDDGDQKADIFDSLRSADFSPPPKPEGNLKPEGTIAGDEPPPAPEKQLFVGTNQYVTDGKGSMALRQDQSGAIELNFDNADLREVARVIMADLLELNYVMDPRVQGSVTISTSAPLEKEYLLATLETLLRMNNAGLLVEGSLYRIVPIAEVAGQPSIRQLGDSERPLPAGYGVTILPLQHVSAVTLIQLLDTVISRPGSLRADAARNILLISGSSRERAAVAEAARSFDVDWLRGQSAGIFPLKHSTPDTVIAELEEIFQARPEGLGGTLIRFLPIERLNAVLVVAKRANMLRESERWIDRLDQANTVGLNLYVYYVENGKAEDLATILNDAFADLGEDTGAQSQRRVSPNLDPVVVSQGGNQNQQQGQTNAGQDQSAQQDTGQAAAVAARLARARAQAASAQTATAGARGFQGGIDNVGQIRVIADTVNNALLVTATRAGWELVQSALRQIDVPPLQVLIDATIAEVTLNDDLKYGVQWFLRSDDVGLDEDAFNIGFFGDETDVLQRSLPGFNFVLYGASQPRAVIDALASVTDVKVISSPSVVVLDNQSATLEVGDEVPISTRQSSSVDDADAPIVNNIEFRNTGVILDVTPRINSSGLVTMEIEQEVSNVNEQVESGTLTPTISQRRIASSIAVNSGQTVVLGGLISESQTEGNSGIPGLRTLPVLGPIFGTTSNTSTRTELIVFITPRVIRSGEDAQIVAEELRSRMRSLAPVNQQPSGQILTE